MKFLCLDTYIHHKNKIGFILMCQAKNIDYLISKSQADFDKRAAYANARQKVAIHANQTAPTSHIKSL